MKRNKRGERNNWPSGVDLVHTTRVDSLLHRLSYLRALLDGMNYFVFLWKSFAFGSSKSVH